ncbi:unnamed protein product, partial [Mesorhabditis spiculigera]
MFSSTTVVLAALLGVVSANYAVYNINKWATEACGARKNVRRTDIRAVFDSTGANTVKFYGLNNAPKLADAIADDANIPLHATLTSMSKKVSVKSYLKGKATATKSITANGFPYSKGDDAAIMTRFIANSWKSSNGLILQMSQYISNGATLLYDYELAPNAVQMVPMYLAVDGDFTGDVTFYQAILCNDGTTWTTKEDAPKTTAKSTVPTSSATTATTPTTAAA